MAFVDAHVHVIAPALLEQRWGPRVRIEDGVQVVELDGRAIRSAVGEFVDVERILEQTRADRVVLSPWVPLLGGELPRLRLQNAALAELAGPRAAVLGAVPLRDAPLAAAELRELMAGPFAGVEVTAQVDGDHLGAERFAPFWAAAEETGALVFVHPSTRGFAGPPDHYLWNTVGNPLETTIAAAQLVTAGVIERHPELRILLAHGGGAVLALRGRLRHAQLHIAAAGDAPVEDSLRRLYFDTVTHDPALLRALVEFAGPEHVLAGSDHPFDMADPDPVATVRAAGLDAAAEAAILGGNAERLTA
jgi:aminocarboxymuconate-semialdehyde decarboxylase